MMRRINLVPPSERARTTTDVGLLLMLVLTLVVVFGLGFGYYLLNNQLADKEQELADLEQQVAQVEAQVAALRQYEVVKVQRDQMEALVGGIYSARTTVSGILDDVSLVVPNTIWFQNLGLSVADPVIATAASQAGPATSPSDDTMLSVGGTTYTFQDVAQLLVRFQLVPSLKGVELMSAAGNSGGDTGQELKTFTISGSVVDTSPDEELPVSQIQVDIP
jgi:Tfp pilus assembly protein PilN